jgi:hypothetical protein
MGDFRETHFAVAIQSRWRFADLRDRLREQFMITVNFKHITYRKPKGKRKYSPMAFRFQTKPQTSSQNIAVKPLAIAAAPIASGPIA